ncbi:hypothetical protein M406DRAFT_332357 [Cryphonectria parasitica EP155]|uniref:Carrier domain-containing protein n=1 Tax=Cryphonectria parasitica (strain ATCC 38755 / EP155) TaxID=660469 RepID=A0A9P4XZU2_CRYP1|nr:uncharacterized protein M406DRAFT_332357 [Cryphonectria parasitica EP155]KAF3763913.1 hypothetical protein M406DRAFT_332357 [Cryphonectria parasitica EP155]
MASTAAVVPKSSPLLTNPSHSDQESATAEHVEMDDSALQTVDALLRSRATTYPNLPIVSYPKSGVDYVDYTYQQLDVFAYRVARHLESSIPTRTTSAQKRTTVALLGPSNLEYLVTLLALFKAGHTVLFLSIRIPPPAIEALIEATGTSFLIADPRYVETALAVEKVKPGLRVLDMPTRDVFEFPVSVHVDTQLDAALDVKVETNEIVYIIHSSGSTGVPKAIYQKQSAALSNFSVHPDMKAFITLPLYHNHGICNFFRAVWSRKQIHLFNADLPLTSDALVSVMRSYSFEIFYGVPYALKLLAESDEGMKILAALKVVMYGGSACPDDLGNLLVDNGVNLVSHYGATEVGQLMTSFRPAGDKAWNYVRENDKLAPFLFWLPQGPGLFECCVKQGWPAKTATNMDDGSYRTKDLFEPHPTIPRAWKYIARQDDTIVLVNGEKFNPVVTEGKIRSSRLVTEAVVFGAQQPYLGLLVIPSPATAGWSPEQIIDEIWAVVDATQAENDAFAQLSKEMCVILPHDVAYPTTDKGSIIRQAFYKKFAREMETAYTNSNASNEHAQVMSEEQLREFLRGLLSKASAGAQGSVEFDDDTNFFALGVDSLRAIQIRAELLKSVKTARKLTQNVVFEHPSVRELSAYLLGAGDVETEDIEAEMRELVKKYSNFKSEVQDAPKNLGQNDGGFVLVTGSTGSLGAHLVAKLVRDNSIERVYCLVRASDSDIAAKRTTESMTQRKVYDGLSPEERKKIISLPCDLSRADLGLEKLIYQEVCSGLRAVIHSAWPVNFNIKLSTFEDSLAGVKNLINLCQQASSSSNTTPSFNFCSSVSAVVRHPDAEGPVPEAEPRPEWAQGMGYAQSKSVAEAICARAGETSGVPVRVLRIGQIVADTEHGVWNATEGVVMCMQTALTVGALPKLQEEPSWLPVDVVAQGVSEISLSGAGSLFANVANHRLFSWTNDLLPALRGAGLKFEEVEPKEWIRRLRESNPDPVANPPIRLVDFFATKYDKESFAPSKRYVTENARSLSQALADPPLLDQEFVNKFVGQFLSGPWKT